MHALGVAFSPAFASLCFGCALRSCLLLGSRFSVRIRPSAHHVERRRASGSPGDDLNFFSVADSPIHANANGDVKNVELTTMPTPDGRDTVLVRKVIRNLLSETATPNPDVEVICRGVTGFALQYYDGAEWVPTWDSTQEDNTIPAAVQVTLTLTRPDVNGANKSFRFVRVYPLSCSTAAQDSQVNPNANQGLP